jgi:hypothetical protein
MKRITTIGLCFVAALAISALAAGSASALEYVQCGKAAGKGEFSDKACTVAAAGGKYHLSSAVGSSFKAKSSKPLNQLVNPLTKKVEGFFEAKGSKSSGSITGASTSEFVEEFSKVKTNEGKNCNSEGQPKGKIVTNKLGTSLVPIGAGSGQAEVVFAAAGPSSTLATYECEGLKIKVFGGIIAEITGLSGPASKTFSVGVRSRGGTPGNLQEFLYIGGAGTEAEEEEAQDYFEYVGCLAKGNPKAVCEGAVGDGKEPAKPTTLLSEIEPLKVTAPAVQNAKGAVKGKAALKIV